MNLYYRNNNAELYKLFHISVTCGREKEKRNLLERNAVQYTQWEISKDVISNKYDHQNLVYSTFIIRYPPLSLRIQHKVKEYTVCPKNGK